jgi:hypothetical protein
VYVDTEVLSVDTLFPLTGFDPFIQLGDATRGAQHQNDELLASMPALRACSTVSVGYDNFDVDALNQRNVVLWCTSTPKCSASILFFHSPALTHLSSSVTRRAGSAGLRRQSE